MSSSFSSTSPEQQLLQARAEKKRRNRVPVSCGPCRSRKMKCDRHLPCQNCVKRDSADSCSYATNGGRRQRVQQSTTASDEMQQRINRLEGLVLSLMQGQNQISGGDEGLNGAGANQDHDGARDIHLDGENEDEDENEDFDQDGDCIEAEAPAPQAPATMALVTRPRSTNQQGPEDEGVYRKFGPKIAPPEDPKVQNVMVALGIMDVNSGASYFRGETHINAILREISEIKAFYHHSKEMMVVSKEDEGELFPFAASGPRLTIPELLELIPPRHIVDRVLENYFSWYGQLFHIIHRPQFEAEYEEFWRSPETVDALWIAMLFQMMHMSWQLFKFAGNGPLDYQPRAVELIRQYQHASEAALVAGGFTRRKAYHYRTIRTLYLMAAAKVLDEGSEAIWLLLGLIARMSLAMGLHRDGQQYNLPPFDVEIRRRLWTAICCMDMTHAISMGLPSMIRESEYDTKVPMNVLDSDIWEGMTEYPKPRSIDEQTEFSYYIFKSKLVRIYRKIVVHANGIEPKPDYDVIMELDADLRQHLISLPLYLRLSRTPELTADPAYLSLQKIALEIVFHKGMISLHRPYSCKVWKDKKYAYSRKVLVNSCISMIDHQFAMTQFEDDQMKLVRWFSVSIASWDFMHATISLCVDLWNSLKAGDLNTQCLDGSDVDPKRTIQVLERSKLLYSTKYGGNNPDARKTYGIISIVLNKVYSLQNGGHGAERDFYDYASSPAKPTPSDSSASQAVTPGDSHIPTYIDMVDECGTMQTKGKFNYPIKIYGKEEPSGEKSLSTGYEGVFRSEKQEQEENQQRQQEQQRQQIQDEQQNQMDIQVPWKPEPSDVYPTIGVDPGAGLYNIRGNGGPQPFGNEWDDFMQEININPELVNNEWWDSIPAPSEWQSMNYTTHLQF